MSKINQLQWKQAKLNDGSFTDSNNLATALMTQPEIYNTLAYAFGDKYYLQYLTAGSGRVAEKYKALGNVEFMHPLMGDLLKPIAISSTPVGNGLGNATFTVEFAEKYFFEGCVIKFSDDTQARVQNDGIQSENGYTYSLQLVTGDPADFVAAAALATLVRSAASSQRAALVALTLPCCLRPVLPLHWYVRQSATATSRAGAARAAGRRGGRPSDPRDER